MPDPPATDALVPFTMPSLGADMDAGTIIEWLVTPGAKVKRGDVVAIVQTDKSDIDVEVFADGTVVELIVPPGHKVPVGTVLAQLAPSGSARPAQELATAVILPATIEPQPEARHEPRPPVAAHAHAHGISSPMLRHLAEELHVDVQRVRGTGEADRITRSDIEHAASRRRISPRARRLAREVGVDTSELVGEGPVTGDDVLRAQTIGAMPASAVERPRPEPSSADTMRRTIARLMAKSWQEIPHYHVGLRVDVHECMTALAALNEQRDAASRILPGAVLAHAAARAAAAVPGVNGYWIDDAFVPGDGVHLALVVALRRGGLLAPVIHDAAVKDLDTFMAEMRDLVTRARNGRLKASEVSGATITLTELGEGEVDFVTPIIHPPQVAILGIGAIHDEPWADNGMLAVRPVVHATLAGDHRAVDGRLGSLYLNAFRRFLQEPIR